MSSVVFERLSRLREFMADKSLSAYITFSTDPHSGEYVPSHWESRKWISGFTGSAGTVVVTASDAGLWTDSRYFLQAEEQLSGTGIRLFRERVEGVPSISEWLVSVLRQGDKVGFDGYTTPLSLAESLKVELSEHGIEFVMVSDPYDVIWPDRPVIPSGRPFLLGLEYSGESLGGKIGRIRERLIVDGVDCLVLSSLDEIAWTLNMRGDDVHCNPLFLSYLVISKDEVVFYVDSDKLEPEVNAYLYSSNVECREYSEICNDLRCIHGKKIQVSDEINVALYESSLFGNEVIVRPSPVKYLKSVKNDVEIEGFRRAMTRDGVAMVKFLKWLEENVSSSELTELSIDEKLLEFRSAQECFKGISFDTIAGYQEHGAIVHYEATEETSSVLKPEGFLLLDSGAHYLDGTTDITRTIPLGALTEEQRLDYTLVLKGFIQLSMAEFPHGTCGTQLDVLARMYMWRYGVNYGHGTGHGVGHFLNVHEGPHQIRMNNVPAILLPGMTITNEPGIYRAGKYGIRIENTMLVVPSCETEFGRFYKFEQLTLCPIDMRPVVKAMLLEEEKRWIDEYHSMVKKTLAPYLSDEEKAWLDGMASPVL